MTCLRELCFMMAVNSTYAVVNVGKVCSDNPLQFGYDNGEFGSQRNTSSTLLINYPKGSNRSSILKFAIKKLRDELMDRGIVLSDVDVKATIECMEDMLNNNEAATAAKANEDPIKTEYIIFGCLGGVLVLAFIILVVFGIRKGKKCLKKRPGSLVGSGSKASSSGCSTPVENIATPIKTTTPVTPMITQTKISVSSTPSRTPKTSTPSATTPGKLKNGSSTDKEKEELLMQKKQLSKENRKLKNEIKNLKADEQDAMQEMFEEMLKKNDANNQLKL